MSDLHDDAEWLESIASDWYHDRERARFRAIAVRLDRAAALEAGLRDLEAELRWLGHDLDEEAADRIAALLAEHGSEEKTG